MSDALFERLMEIGGPERRIAPGETLFRADDPVLSLFLITAGEVHLVRMLPHGSWLALQRAGPRSILAEASVFAERYHCDAVASQESLLRAIPMPEVRVDLSTDPGMAFDLTRYLAGEVQRMRTRAEMLSLKSVAARVDAWMSVNDGLLPPKGLWRQLAHEIGVTPEAVYRDLAKRR